MTDMRMSAARGAILAMIAGLAFAAPALADCPRSGGNAAPPTVVHFDTDSTAIKERFRRLLVELAERHRGNPNMKVCVIGQADKQGNADYNEKLALRRAKAVADFLQQQGLPRHQFDISSRGEAFGETWFGNDPAEADRRVEVLVVRY